MTEQNTNPMVNNIFPSAWFWQAVYKDDSAQNMNDIMPSEINRDNLAEMQLYLDGQIMSAIEFNEDMRLILLYRVTKIMTENGDDLGESKVIIFGWQSTVNGKNIKTIFELYPDGLMIVRNYDKGRKGLD